MIIVTKSLLHLLVKGVEDPFCGQWWQLSFRSDMWQVKIIENLYGHLLHYNLYQFIIYIYIYLYLQNFTHKTS